MKNKFEIFIDTDILREHLFLKRNKNSSVLQKAIDIFDGCYTSVINASEIFSECTDEKMLIKAKNSFEKIGILGIPFRYSVKIGELMKVIKKKTPEILSGIR